MTEQVVSQDYLDQMVENSGRVLALPSYTRKLTKLDGRDKVGYSKGFRMENLAPVSGLVVNNRGAAHSGYGDLQPCWFGDDEPWRDTASGQYVYEQCKVPKAIAWSGGSHANWFVAVVKDNLGTTMIFGLETAQDRNAMLACAEKVGFNPRCLARDGRDVLGWLETMIAVGQTDARLQLGAVSSLRPSKVILDGEYAPQSFVWHMEKLNGREARVKFDNEQRAKARKQELAKEKAKE